MAVATYGQLKSAISGFMLDRDLTAVIGTIVGLGEDRMFRDERLLRCLEKTADLTISAQTVAAPSDYRGHRRLYLNSSTGPEVGFLSPPDFWSRQFAWQTGVPEFYTYEAGNFVFGPSPSSSVTGKLLYYYRPDRFVADEDTNTLLTSHAGIYLYACLVEARGYIGDDPRMQTWGVMYDQAVDDLLASKRLERYPEAVIRSDVGLV